MALTPINTGTGPNTGDGDLLRDAFIKVNANDVELASEIDTKSPIGHTHPMSDIVGLQGALNVLQDNINQVYVNINVNDFAGTDVYNLINGLNNAITVQNVMIQQQNSTIQVLSDIIDDILEQIN